MKNKLVDNIAKLLKERYGYELRGELRDCLKDYDNKHFSLISGLKLAKSEINNKDYEPMDNNYYLEMVDANNNSYTLNVYDYGSDDCCGIQLFTNYENDDLSKELIDKRFSIEYFKLTKDDEIRISYFTFVYGNDFLRYNDNNGDGFLAIYKDAKGNDILTMNAIKPDLVCNFRFIPNGIEFLDNQEIFGDKKVIYHYIINNEQESMAHRIGRIMITLDNYFNYYLGNKNKGSK